MFNRIVTSIGQVNSWPLWHFPRGFFFSAWLSLLYMKPQLRTGGHNKQHFCFLLSGDRAVGHSREKEMDVACHSVRLLTNGSQVQTHATFKNGVNEPAIFCCNYEAADQKSRALSPVYVLLSMMKAIQKHTWKIDSTIIIFVYKSQQNAVINLSFGVWPRQSIRWMMTTDWKPPPAANGTNANDSSW